MKNEDQTYLHLKQHFESKAREEAQQKQDQAYRCHESMLSQAQATKLVTAQDVALQISNTAQDGAHMLVERAKPLWPNYEQDMQMQFDRDVESFCD